VESRPNAVGRCDFFHTHTPKKLKKKVFGPAAFSSITFFWGNHLKVVNPLLSLNVDFKISFSPSGCLLFFGVTDKLCTRYIGPPNSPAPSFVARITKIVPL